ncbi:CDP-alcohol phosphatidyltransferase family protein [Rhabdochlamydiaceae symbiont of Dictyostelium giganteum]|uniref:CDP-alcohol phosphatidyltransferase family protein n=1 Tax=Rhabdochlamydiaceae symbiont of Dictyostelium giganteum TaxID=3342349 RepID=UPI00384EEDEF
MINISNSLSLLRAPLAFLFLIESPMLRLMATFLAMLTDSIDGYLARRSKTASRFGAVLDPAMDKFFVFFALGALWFENKIELWQLVTMVSRDIALCIFGLYLSASNRWHTYEFRSIRWGKITTALQFIVLIALSLGYEIPTVTFYAFVGFALLGLYELFQFKKVTAEA